MAAPVITRTGTGQSKTAGTTLAITLTTTSYSLGDYVLVNYGMDPTAGAVSFAKTAGTAVVGTWTNAYDATTGSGTAGCRGVLSYAKVTTAGTITTITVTLPSTTAKAAEVFKVAGADGTTPRALASEAALNGTTTDAGKDVALFAPMVLEATSGAAMTTGNGSLESQPPWTLTYFDATSFGTSAGAAATNISVGAEVDSLNGMSSTESFPLSFGPTSAPSTQIRAGYLLFQSPQPVATVYPGPPIAVLRSVMRASLY